MTNFQFSIFQFPFNLSIFQFSNWRKNGKWQMANGKSRKGFTLIELMVAMTIVGILVAISTTAYQGAKRSARDADRKADLEDIRSAIEIYRADCGSYPATLTFGTALTATCNGVTNTYMSIIPEDSQNVTMRYRYRYFNNYPSAGKYEICAYLENHAPSDPGFSCGGVGDCQQETNGPCFYRATNP